MNASTFSGRVTGSTLADPYTVVSSAVGTLSGPLHGGANEQVLDMLREIGSVQDVESYVENKMVNKERIMGFGHRVYKTKDPRAVILRRLADEMTEEHGSTELYEIALKVDEIVTERLGEKGIYANVDFYSGIVYDALGIRTNAFYANFCHGASRRMACTLGWNNSSTIESFDLPKSTQGNTTFNIFRRSNAAENQARMRNNSDRI